MFIIIFTSGYRLKQKGKPYNIFNFNIHKFLALAVLAFIIVTIYKSNNTSALNITEFLLCIITGLLFLFAIISGGLLNIEKTMPASITIIHKLTPYLIILSTAITLYYIL